ALQPDRVTGRIELDALDAADNRPTECVGRTYPDLVVTRVRGLVAEQDQVEGALRLLGLTDRPRQRVRDGLRIVLLGFGHDPGMRTHRDRIPQLLRSVLRSRGEHGDAAAVFGDDPNRFLHGALLVRADREP